MANIPITLKIYEGGQLSNTVTLTEDLIRIGKLSSMHVKLEDENVSRMHAVIEVNGPNEVFLMDAGSTAGTILNGQKIVKQALKSGDEIMVGSTKIVVEFQSGSPAMVGAGSAAVNPSPAANPFAAGPSVAPNPFGVASQLANPFAATATSTAFGGGHGEPEDDSRIRYGVAASGPPVNPAEVETGEAAVEVVVMWGESVLHVAHLNPPRAFSVGEGGAGEPVDYLMGQDVLGTTRLPILTDGNAVVIPSGAEGEVTVESGALSSFAQLESQGHLRPSNAMAGAKQYVLPAGATARVRYHGFTFVVRPTSAAKMFGVPKDRWRPGVLLGGLWTSVLRDPFIPLSFGVHAALLLIMYFWIPDGSGLSGDLFGDDDRLLEILMDAAEQVEEEPEIQETANNESEGGTGKRHKGDEGQMGDERSQKTRNRFGIEGPADNADPHMARENARQQASTAGAVGVLASMVGSWNSPTSPFGQDTALGADPMSALGAMFGDQIGSNFGYGGLGLRGTGRGGGGTGEGTIGLGNLGTIGHGSGNGTGQGYGSGAGGFSGRRAGAPRVRTSNAEVRGSLSAEVIRRVVRRHLNEVRFCYEQQLQARPDLAGRVAVTFIISPTGAVQSANVANSTLSNAPAEQCIVTAVRRWSFPAPDGGGSVGVTYPFMLDSNG